MQLQLLLFNIVIKLCYNYLKICRKWRKCPMQVEFIHQVMLLLRQLLPTDSQKRESPFQQLPRNFDNPLSSNHCSHCLMNKYKFLTLVLKFAELKIDNRFNRLKVFNKKVNEKSHIKHSGLK